MLTSSLKSSLLEGDTIEPRKLQKFDTKSSSLVSLKIPLLLAKLVKRVLVILILTPFLDSRKILKEIMTLPKDYTSYSKLDIDNELFVLLELQSFF